MLYGTYSTGTEFYELVGLVRCWLNKNLLSNAMWSTMTSYSSYSSEQLAIEFNELYYNHSWLNHYQITTVTIYHITTVTIVGLINL